MKSKIFTFPGRGIVIIFFFCFSILSLPLKAQLSGVKTINPSGGNYTSFTAAITDLTTQGINGPVIFNVASGTYNEQVVIPEITGASAVNTIVFQSQSGDSSQVILSYNSTSAANNFTLKLNNSD
ncbi:MAG: hypothetical protein H6538_00520 [Bacteroidales bacterium]|nr:hypothetical protein [Bacteroidales bacterium]MCB8998606.1 hypothetical protein [Bacteroidales bacterium]MCB9012526.1 hypothetical protein [Bacteroidales bacterium]